jgi:hypothetical protein
LGIVGDLGLGWMKAAPKTAVAAGFAEQPNPHPPSSFLPFAIFAFSFFHCFFFFLLPCWVRRPIIFLVQLNGQRRRGKTGCSCINKKTIIFYNLRKSAAD